MDGAHGARETAFAVVYHRREAVSTNAPHGAGRPRSSYSISPRAKSRAHARLCVSKKSACGVLFRVLTLFSSRPMGLPGGKQRKEPLRSKGSESAAHVAGFGLHLEGCGPPNHPNRFFDSLSRAHARLFMCRPRLRRALRACRPALFSAIFSTPTFK